MSTDITVYGNQSAYVYLSNNMGKYLYESGYFTMLFAKLRLNARIVISKTSNSLSGGSASTTVQSSSSDAQFDVSKTISEWSALTGGEDGEYRRNLLYGGPMYKRIRFPNRVILRESPSESFGSIDESSTSEPSGGIPEEEATAVEEEGKELLPVEDDYNKVKFVNLNDIANSSEIRAIAVSVVSAVIKVLDITKPVKVNYDVVMDILNKELKTFTRRVDNEAIFRACIEESRNRKGSYNGILVRTFEEALEKWVHRDDPVRYNDEIESEYSFRIVVDGKDGGVFYTMDNMLRDMTLDGIRRVPLGIRPNIAYDISAAELDQFCRDIVMQYDMLTNIGVCLEDINAREVLSINGRYILLNMNSMRMRRVKSSSKQEQNSKPVDSETNKNDEKKGPFETKLLTMLLDLQGGEDTPISRVLISSRLMLNVKENGKVLYV